MGPKVILSTHGVPLGHLIEQALVKVRGDDLSDSQFVGLMAASSLGVFAVAGAISHFANRRQVPAEKEDEPLVSSTATPATPEGAVGYSSLTVLLSIPALFAH